MDKLNKTLNITTSPHISGDASVEQIMRNVVYALLPVCAFSIYSFGLAALLVLITAVVACVVTEHVFCTLSHRQSSINDWSVVITGILYGLTLPPALPLWMVATGAIIAVALGKLLFGGLGYNPFNPALVGRAFLQAAFPVAMTSWTPALLADRFVTLPSSTLTFPFAIPYYDSISEATPLALWKFEQTQSDISDLLFGFSNGSIGETCSVLILLGGLYLIARNMMSWRIPLGIFTAIIILNGLLYLYDSNLYPSPLFSVFSGGVMLGAMFMATDPVASPVTSRGCFIYGLLIGSLIVVIRFWGGMPEGVMYAILLANAASSHIDALTQPRPFAKPSGGSQQ